MATSPILDHPLDDRSAHSQSSFDGRSSLRDINNGSGMFLQEDDNCFMLSLEMPGVNGNDLEISLVNTILTIAGYRRSSSSNACRKRQRIHRTLAIDPNSIDVNRAIARVWNGCLTLYAPKKPSKYSPFATTSSRILMGGDSAGDSLELHYL